MKDFLNQIFKSNWKASKLKGDSGERAYYRISSDRGPFIFVEPSKENNNFEDFIEIQQLLHENDIPVPQIKALNEKEKLLLLEDLGTLSLEKFYLKKKNLNHHFQAIDSLIVFQNLKPRKFRKSFTNIQGIHEMLSAYQDIKKNLMYSDKENLFKEFKKINDEVIEGGLIPSHRDFHSRNLFIYNSQVYMIDFQDAGLYPIYYDLVSLAYDSYVEFSNSDQEKLLQYYEQKKEISLDRRLLSLTFFQRTFKAIGSFFKFYRQRRQRTHLKYVHPCLQELQKQLTQSKSYPYFLKYIQCLLEDK